MGLGKTIQAVGFLNTLIHIYKQRGPYLVIAPLSTLSHWKATVENWTFLNVVVYHDTNGAEGRNKCRDYETYFTDIMKRGGISKKSKLVKFHIMVTSYEVFMADFHSYFSELPFQLIIIDEAHRLKNKKAKLLQILRQIPCKRYVLMTGTPLQNNTDELWSLLNFIEPGIFHNLYLFSTKYGNLETRDQVEMLQKELEPYLYRRLKEDVERSIPPLQETIIDVELTNIQKTYYRAIYERNRAFLCKGGSNPILNNLEIQLRKCCNHPFLLKGVEIDQTKECITEDERVQKISECSGKMVLIDKLLPKVKSQGKKVLIFSQFTQMLNILEEYLAYHNYKIERLDGSVKAIDRQVAIDRFNNPENERDVFLLSTRAGGLGINLTSAQVVIIFDSDWNPQNDVQATARAHRIGQTEEVQVYRLITARTYEAQMFERASRKLGLDQAVFNKETRNEIETLLKYGAYNLVDDDNTQRQRFFESDIDDILMNKTRVVNYSVVRGCYTLSKQSFVSQTSDATINVDDPNFWSKIMPPSTSPARHLLTKLNDKSFSPANQGAQFMEELEAIVKDLIQAKSEKKEFNFEDEEILLSLLLQISQTKQFNRTHRQQALQWSNEISRPTRQRTKTQRDEPPAYLSGSESEEEDSVKKYTTFGGTGILCAHCEKEGCGWFCVGPCKKAFHTDCLNQRLDEDHDDSLPINEEFQALDNWGWMCKECEQEIGRCFKCGKKSVFANNSTGVKGKKEGLTRCSLNRCGKFYHLSCLKQRPKKRFICPWHSCKQCGSSANAKTLVQCVRCPSAFHLRCYPRKVTRLNKFYIVCHQHPNLPKTTVYPTERSQDAQEVARVIKDNLKEASARYKNLSHIEGRKYQGRRKVVVGEDEGKELYIQFAMPPPQEVDYENYVGDWCRYCGARKATSFTLGPWGKKMLCITHYSEWKQKKILQDIEDTTPPTIPVNLSANSELKYLKKLRQG